MIDTKPLCFFRNFLCLLVFLALTGLWCKNFFSFSALNSHVMLDGDPALNAWALSWVTHALSTDWFNLLNGNTFYPHPGAITLSEHMTGIAIFNLPLQLITHNPWVGYNIAILCAYILSALGGYKLIAELTHSRLAGLWGGIFWAFCFFRVHHIGHLQILAYQWFPFIALYLLRTIKYPTYTNTLLLALFFILQALTSWYLAVIASFFVLIIFICNMSPTNFNRQHFSVFLLSGILVLSAVLPFALSYIGTFNDSSLSDRLSAINTSSDQVKLLDFFFPPASTLWGALITDNKYWIWGENTLYIGYSACLLALIGIRHGWRTHRRLTITALALICMGFILALGYSSASLGIKLPLYYVSQAFPLLAAMRATQRYALLIYFGVLILSGFGIAGLTVNRKRLVRYILTAGFCGIFLLEVYPYKLPFGAALLYTPSALDMEIASMRSADNKPTVILHLPIHTAMPGYATPEATYMTDSTLHWGNILNGFSGAEPLGFKKDMLTLNQIPTPQSLDLLKQYGVDILAIHQTLVPERREMIKKYFLETGLGEIRPVNREEYLVIFKRSNDTYNNASPSRQ